jgi:uncharacterized Tic20 family protein
MQTLHYKNNQELNSRLAMYLHASALLGTFIPMANVLAPLIFWLSKKDENESLNKHGIRVLNFQLSIVLYMFIAGLFSIVLIGIPFLIGLMLFWIIQTVINSVKAANGEEYNYPMTIEFIKMPQ